MTDPSDSIDDLVRELSDLGILVLDLRSKAPPIPRHSQPNCNDVPDAELEIPGNIAYSPEWRTKAGSTFMISDRHWLFKTADDATEAIFETAEKFAEHDLTWTRLLKIEQDAPCQIFSGHYHGWPILITGGPDFDYHLSQLGVEKGPPLPTATDE